MDIQTQYDLMNPAVLEVPPTEGYALVTIAAGNITEYHGKGEPAYARLYANEQFTAVNGVIVGQGSVKKPDFYQEFKADMDGDDIFLYDGDAYATTNSNRPGATYTLAVYDAKGRVLITPYTRLKIPHTNSPTSWQALEGFSRGVPLDYPSTYLDTIGIYQIIAGLVAAQPEPGPKEEIYVHNSTDWRVIEAQLAAAKVVDKHLSTFASVGSLIGEASANSSRPYIITVDETEKVDNMTFPNNLFFDYSKGFGLYVNAGQIASITPPVNAPPHLLFPGPGQARIKKHYAFKNADAVWYVPPGSAARSTITWDASEALRYATFNNDGGEILFGSGEYQIDHYCSLQRGGVRGAANDPNGKGTVIYRTGGLYNTKGHYADKGGEGYRSIFRFLPGGRNMFVRDMVLKSDEPDTAAMLCRDVGTVGSGNQQSIDGIFIDNVTVRGCAEGYKVEDTHANKNWQVHNAVSTRRTMFVQQTVACISIDSVNAGGDFVAANCEPAPNGTAVGFKGYCFAKTRLDFNGIGVQGWAFDPDLPESIQPNFNPANVDIATNSLKNDPGNPDDPLEDVLAGLENADRVYLEGTVTLPAGLVPHTSYWWNKNSRTFHRNVQDALFGGDAGFGQNPVDITDVGSGVFKLHSSRPNPELTAQQPFADIEILGDFSEGLTIDGLKRDEGTPWLLYIHDNVRANMSASIDLINCVSLGQIYAGSSHRINLRGGQFRTQCFKDGKDSASIIHNYGANLYTYGVGGAEGIYGGYAVHGPRGFADFKGKSFFYVDDRYYAPEPPDLSVAGQATFNIAERSEFELRVDGTDLALNFVGGDPEHSKMIRLWIFSTADTTLTQGTGCALPSGQFVTGTFVGARYALEFYWDGLYAVELGRKSGQYHNPQLTGAVKISGPTGNLAIEGRDGESIVRIYSEPSERMRFYADVGARDMLSLTLLEAAFEGRIATKVTAAPVDADMVFGQLVYWYDEPNAKVKFKAKDLLGAIKTGEVPLA
jgi:hypothetical protein